MPQDVQSLVRFSPDLSVEVVSAPAPAAGDTKEVSSPKRRRTAAGKDNLKTKSLQVWSPDSTCTREHLHV